MAASNANVRFDPKTKKFDFSCCRRTCLPPISTPACSTGRRLLVHRPEWRARLRQCQDRQGRKLEIAARRQLRHHRDPGNDVWYAALAGDHLGKINKATGTVDIVEPHKKARAPGAYGRTPRGALGELLVLRRSRPLRSRGEGLEDLASARQPGSGCYSVYVDEQDKVWLTDFLTIPLFASTPAAETFETYRAASGARRCARCSAGMAKAWGAESGNDRLVQIKY